MTKDSITRKGMNILIIITLVFSLIPPSLASGTANENGLKISWNFDIDGEVSIIKSNEYGTEWYVGTKNGLIYKFDEQGNEVWDNPIRHQFNPIIDLVISSKDNTITTVYKYGSYSAIYFMDLDTLTVWHKFENVERDISVVNDRERWYILFSEFDGTGSSYICYMDRDNGDMFLAPGMDTNTLQIIPSAYLDFKPYSMLVASSLDNSKDLIKISLGDFPDISILPPLSDMSYYPEFPDMEYSTGATIITDTYYDLLEEFPYVNVYTISPNVVTGTRDYYTQDVIIYRSSGTDNIDSDGNWHVYLGYDCRPNYANLRFYDSEGEEIPYYIQNYDVVNANILLRIPESSQIQYMLIGYGGSLTTSNSNKEGVYEFVENFDTLDSDVWYQHTERAGTLRIVPDANQYVEIECGHDGGIAYASLVSKEGFDGDFIVSMKCRHSNNANFYLHALGLFSSEYIGSTSGFFHNDIDKLPVRYHIERLNFDNNNFRVGDARIDVENTADWQWHDYDIKREGLYYTLTVDKTNDYQVIESISVPYYHLAFTQVPHSYYRFETNVRDITVRGIARTPSEIDKGATPIMSSVIQSVPSPITDVKITDSHILLQTTNSLHTYKVEEDGTLSLTTQVTGLSGTPYSVDVANDGLITIEGRGSTVNIYRYDGVTTGTYDTGGIISNTELSRANGLYALATSADGKYYVFSKDEGSMWYLLYSSPTGSEITASHLTDYADYIAVARGSDLQVLTLEEAEGIVKGSITLRIYDGSNPYADKPIIIQHSEDGVWTESETYTTDSQGVVVIEVEFGKKLNVIIGYNIHTRTLIPTPAQPEYIIQIPFDEPLRSGAKIFKI